MPKPWEGGERVTVLLMGLDYRDWEKGEGPPRTDTMILLTLDPVTETAGMMNIPRDLWVSIPGFDYGRINTAYPLGEASITWAAGLGWRSIRSKRCWAWDQLLRSDRLWRVRALH